MPRPADGHYRLTFLNGEGVEEDRDVEVNGDDLIVPPAWNGPLTWFDLPAPGGFYRAGPPAFGVMFDYPSAGRYTAQVGTTRYEGPYRRV